MRCELCVLSLVALFGAPMVGPAYAGQIPSTAGDASTSPHTAWGQPDLQGVWDFRTLTPMERPDELADKQVLTAEE